MIPEPKLRLARRDDNGFRCQIFVKERRGELASLGWAREQEEAFLQSQFERRERAYEQDFPAAPWQIIEVDGQAGGCLLVHRGPAALTLVDLLLIPPLRGQGIGTRLLRDLVAEGNRLGRPVRLSVLRGSRALRLYLRLGFQILPDDGRSPYLRMEKASGRPAKV
jgi:GNAT superfamily N-acetyltransferase